MDWHGEPGPTSLLIDRILCVAIGLALIAAALGLFGPACQSTWGWISLVPLATVLINWCSLCTVTENAARVLRRSTYWRFARGDIDKAEYEKKKRSFSSNLLRGQRVSTLRQAPVHPSADDLRLRRMTIYSEEFLGVLHTMQIILKVAAVVLLQNARANEA